MAHKAEKRRGQRGGACVFSRSQKCPLREAVELEAPGKLMSFPCHFSVFWSHSCCLLPCGPVTQPQRLLSPHGPGRPKTSLWSCGFIFF